MNAWALLILGIVFEVMGSFCLKLSHGFTNLWPSLFGFVFFVIALSLITLSAKILDIGVVYAVWSGVGIVIISTIGMSYFGEAISIKKIACISLILIGVLGLHSESFADTKEQEDVYSAE